MRLARLLCLTRTVLITVGATFFSALFMQVRHGLERCLASVFLIRVNIDEKVTGRQQTMIQNNLYGKHWSSYTF